MTNMKKWLITLGLAISVLLAGAGIAVSPTSPAESPAPYTVTVAGDFPPPVGG